MRTTLEAYVARGWRLVKIAKGEKGPKTFGWPDLSPPPGEFVDCNVGIALGTRSGGLVDVDLDCAEAVELAPEYLLPTWTFGRASNPRSHWLYQCADCETERFQFRGDTLLELRSDGLQTVFPPSVHPSGEAIQWTPGDCDATDGPRVVEVMKLSEAVSRLAVAALFRRTLSPAAFATWRAGAFPPVTQEVAAQARRYLGLEVYEPPKKASGAVDTLLAAVEAYNAANKKEHPQSGGTCPICGHNDCFGRLKDTDRWCCFSTGHFEGGVQGEKVWTGDALDIDAHAESCTRAHLLRKLKYLEG